VIDPDRLAPIALFAVEAISNACKHGLEDGGQLSVGFRVRDSRGDLSICDSGRPGRTAKLGVGVGRTLMTAYARQLRGEATFKPNAGGGLTARVVFPIPESGPPGDEAPPERLRSLSPAAVR
jgi:two-component sensor histidine kinase